MTILSKHTRFTNAAALRIGAACILAGCLIFGLLPLGVWGVASADEKAPETEGSPVVALVEASTSNEAPNTPELTAPKQNSTASKPADLLGSADTSADALAPKTSTVPESPAPSETLPSKPSGSTDSSNPSSSSPDAPANELVWQVGLDNAAAVTVALHPNGTLEVQGVGKTVVFSEVEAVDGTKSITTPWLAEGYAAHIKRVEFASTVEPVSLAYWFDGCKNLTEVVTLPASATASNQPSSASDATDASTSPAPDNKAPEASALPASVKDLTATFRNCEQLVVAPALPKQAETLASAFEGCTQLQRAPSIPASVRDLSLAFGGCSLLAEVPQIEATPQNMDKAFFDCPAIIAIPETFAFAASSSACFGFTDTLHSPVATIYDGSDSAVLAYNWARDGRVLVKANGEERTGALGSDSQNPGNSPGTTDKETDGASSKNPAGESSSAGSVNGSNSGSQNSRDPSKAQVNLTVPSSVPLLLGSDGPNSASIPVSIENRSDTAVKIVGASLNRAEIDYPGGAWSLVASATGQHFIDDARFTPRGLEAVLTTPVRLSAHSGTIDLVWEGTFTDYGMKTLLTAAALSDDAFIYGTLIWHVEAI